MKMDVVIESGGFMPIKAHDDDAGFDLRTPYSFVLSAHSSATIDTRVHFGIPHGYVGFLKSKSGLNVNCGITCEGVIDCGFTGSVRAKLFNNSDNDKLFLAGDKITQIVFLPIPDVTLVECYELPDSDRGNNGFGSTGR